MPTVKANLKRRVYTKWLVAKAQIGDGREISNDMALEQLIDYYNREKGRRII